MSIEQAFNKICNEAKAATGHYVSLYVNTPYYGGPEEGGWWGSDTSLVSYQQFPTEEAAQAAKKAVEKLAQELSDEAKRTFGQKCQQDMEWLDARGLDADYLPEVDGEESYFVAIEQEPGSLVSEGCRHYE